MSMVRFAFACSAAMLLVLATGASAAHTLSSPPRPSNTRNKHADVVFSVGGMMIKASSAKPADPMRLRGGGASHGALPKYPSNVALHKDEYAAPYGTIMRTRSGAMIAPTPTPEWFDQGLMYQIYPLGTPGTGGGGFFGGVPATNDGVSSPTQKILNLRKWYTHLKELGVTSIYFSPLFESETHGYDTIDYFSIDRRVGDLESFKTIVRELHELGIKVILDGVFNHTGRGFFAFQALLKAGKNWAKSEYKDWYFIAEGNSTFGDPFAYRSWEGHEELPELNVENAQVREHLFKVAKFWLGEVGVDGWRLDVAHELPPSFWRDFRTVCTEANPEHVLLGEVIHGDYNTWVGPTKGLLHSGTNYQLSKALWSSLKEHNFWELDSAIQRDLMLYREMSLVNFLSNHDVARVATQLEDEPLLNKLAHFMLLTFRGTPCIYYGDEVGVKGCKEDGDAALRMKMVDPDVASGEWPAGGKELYDFIAKLVAFRNLHPALVCGAHQPLYHQNNEMVYARRTPDGSELLVIAVNSAAEHSHVEVAMGCLDKAPGTLLKCLWGDGADCGSINDEFKVRIHLPPYSGRIFTLSHVKEPASEGEAPEVAGK